MVTRTQFVLYRLARDEIGGRYVWIDILPGPVGRMQLFGNVFWCYFYRITYWNHCYFNDHITSTAKQVGSCVFISGGFFCSRRNTLTMP